MKKDFLYMELYHHFQERIMNQSILPGEKMPSIRKCTIDMNCSRTTVENAYLQLAADGYIIAKSQSGYYVTSIARHALTNTESPVIPTQHAAIKYDLSSTGVDRESFDFELWRRYLKSALRQNERLLNYGEPQGEYDFRQALAKYVRDSRNIICSPDDIVIGAGTQNLLQILAPLLNDRKTVSFPSQEFVHGPTVFNDYGFDVHFRDKNCEIIYVSPAHMTKWGQIMPVSRRMELTNLAQENNSIIIEDDFENEFVYLQKPTPSLFNLSGGKNVVYIGSFSRLLLPSIRVSFMILSGALRDRYRERSKYYNQTASKAEQIALCQFIRDGHLKSQIRKLRRLYTLKIKSLTEAIEKVFGTSAKITPGDAGTSISLTLTLPHVLTNSFIKEIEKKAQTNGLRLPILNYKDRKLTLLLSASSMSAQDYQPACEILHEILYTK
ncbi:MAG: PLP-dependent aminotransferase family protein [Eubacteriales bacterium]|nr:PLP-dependent aminotransferase family protein [Eubacteriales bacterium]